MDVITFLLAALIVEVIIREYLERSGKMSFLKKRFGGKTLVLIAVILLALIVVFLASAISGYLGLSILIKSIICGVLLGLFLPILLILK